MRLRPRELAGWLAGKAQGAAGLLLHGPDPAALRLRRDEVLIAVAGPGAEAEMRLVRLAPAALRADPALLPDALRARGFFPGPRAVLVEEAGDGLAATVGAALADALPGEDAFLLVTAEALPARSRLRTLFEQHARAAALQLQDAPPGPAELAEMLARAGIARAEPAALEALAALARELDAGSLARLVEVLALHGLGEAGPLAAGTVALLAPGTRDAGIDAALAAAAEGRVEALGPALARLADQGTQPVTLCIAAGRHFRLLHAALAAADGPEAALARARPPVWGPRREALLAQLRGWSLAGLEAALAALTATDLALRSAPAAPARALVERTLIRIAAQRGGARPR